MNYSVKKDIKPEKVEMRKTFAEVLDRLAEADERVVYLDCDLANSIGMANFIKERPKQGINCGIQEANMIGAAAGMSAVGLIPFVHTFGTFATRRVMDQVFVSGAYAKNNIRIIGSDPGITASMNGGTHMPLEDMGMMRTIPEVTIIEPVDSVMLADILIQTKDLFGIFYIRLSRKISEGIFEEGSHFEIGKAAPIKDGTDVTIFATGISVADSLIAAEMLESDGVSAEVINMFTIKPVDRDAIRNAAQKTGAIVTAENHNIIGGLGSAVAEVVAEEFPVPVERVGVQDLFGEVGDVGYLKKRFSMEPSDIAAAAKRAVERKRSKS